MKVFFYALLAPTVNFDPKRDKLFVVFGPERDDWECKKEGEMRFSNPKRYLYE